MGQDKDIGKVVDIRRAGRGLVALMGTKGSETVRVPSKKPVDFLIGEGYKFDLEKCYVAQVGHTEEGSAKFRKRVYLDMLNLYAVNGSLGDIARRCEEDEKYFLSEKEPKPTVCIVTLGASNSQA